MRIKRYCRRLLNYKRLLALGILLLLFWDSRKNQIKNVVGQSRKWYIPDSDFFKPILYLKPAQNKKTGIKFFSEKVKADTDFRLNGFRYCAALDNSWFYGNVFIDKLNGTVMAKNPIRQTIIDLIDDAAKNISVFIYDKSPEALENVFLFTKTNRMFTD